MKQYRTIVIVLFAAAALARNAEAGPEFLEHYKRGVSAIESERWGHAVQSLDSAIQERGDEAKRLPKYFYIKPYIPHFYRGYALFKLGDCRGALEAWKISEQQGVVTQLSQNEQIELARQICRSKAESSARPSAPPPPEPTRQAPPPTRRESRVDSSPPRTINPVPPSSPQYRNMAQPTPEPRQERYEPATTPDEEPWASGSQEVLEATPTKPAGPPPDDLLETARLYLGGSYQQALDLLTQARPTDPFTRAHGHLLAGAAELGLYLEGGEREAGRLEAARRHVLETRRLLPDLEPQERFFSPRFLDFYYGQRPEEQR